MRWDSRECLLSPTDISPSLPDWRVIGVFNAGAYEEPGGRVILGARIAEAPAADRSGWVALPYWDVKRGPAIDWEPATDWEAVDQRVWRNRARGQTRLSTVSHLRLFDCGKGTDRPREIERLVPLYHWETYGMEDARFSRIGDSYFMTYVAVSPWGVCTAWATSSDGWRWERQGILLPPDNKDVVFFPEKISGKYAILHRPMCSMPWSNPAIWIAWSHDGRYFGDHTRLYSGGRFYWETERVGVGPPPLRVDRDWLVIYHGSAKLPTQSVGRYTAGAMLLAGEEPHRILAVSPEPLLVPDREFENEGFVPAVVFPTGLVCRQEKVWLYYGAADTSVGVATGALSELLKSLEPTTQSGFRAKEEALTETENELCQT